MCIVLAKVGDMSNARNVERKQGAPRAKNDLSILCVVNTSSRRFGRLTRWL